MKEEIIGIVYLVVICVAAGAFITVNATNGRWWLVGVWVLPPIAAGFSFWSMLKLHYWKGRRDEASNWWGSSSITPSLSPPLSRWWKNG